MSTYSCPDCGARVPDNEVCPCALNRRPQPRGLCLGRGLCHGRVGPGGSPVS